MLSLLLPCTIRLNRYRTMMVHVRLIMMLVMMMMMQDTT